MTACRRLNPRAPPSTGWTPARRYGLLSAGLGMERSAGPRDLKRPGGVMPAHDDLLIRVQSAWNGWRSAEARLRDLQSVHWFQPGLAPHPLVHGYISCAHILAGEIPHDCDG